MASIALGIGLSHGPSIETTPDKWFKLAERDKRDSRYSYQALLAAAPDGLQKHLAEDVLRQKYDAAHAAIAALKHVLDRVEPDAMVVISNAHGRPRVGHNPVFGVLRAAQFYGKARSSPHTESTGDGLERERKPREHLEVSGLPEFADHLIEHLIEDCFDIACMDEFPDGEALDGAFAFPQQWLFGGRSIPTVPFLLSRDLPNQATPKRCLELGSALGRAIEAWADDLKILIVASGGLSHQIVDEELDRQVIQALVNGDPASLAGLSRDRLNRGPGTPEILNWITVAAAMSPSKMNLVDYIPCYRSPAGTGHGLTFGYWQ
jgi:hypothetical protein